MLSVVMRLASDTKFIPFHSCLASEFFCVCHFPVRRETSEAHVVHMYIIESDEELLFGFCCVRYFRYINISWLRWQSKLWRPFLALSKRYIVCNECIEQRTHTHTHEQIHKQPQQRQQNEAPKINKFFLIFHF